MTNLLNSNGVNVNVILIVVAIVAVIAIIFAVLIVSVSKLCYVKEDERVKSTQELLSGANCGGCGYAGCADFAKALAEGKASLSSCNATSNESKMEIAKILSIPFCASAEVFAVVKCAGGKNAKDKFEYVGNSTCEAKSALLGGSKVCSFGCEGGGDCASVCSDMGVFLKDGCAVIDKNACVACGACIKKCPKKLIEFIPKSATVYVACSSNCKGKEVLSACTIGCIGCGLCAKNCPTGAISMVDNLAVIDYDKCNGCKTCVNKCPRKTIKEI